MIRFKKVPDNIEELIGNMVRLLEKEPNIVFAYLFGGLAREKKGPFSDVDIAVYVSDSNKLDYLELFGKIIAVLETEEVDLVILNAAPISLAGRIVKGRIVLIDKNPFLRHKYESLTLREFFDFEIEERTILREKYGIG
jgi:uncharacterized protein